MKILHRLVYSYNGVQNSFQKIGEPELVPFIKTIEWVSQYSESLRSAIKAMIYPVFVVMVLIYPPYPASFSIVNIFVKRGFESAVSEFELVRKILYVAIPLLILFTVIEFLKPFIEQFVCEEL
ncbi:MAG TPA: hypothetical protein VD710_01165 [Nitrososphaeraceae archaeon]|nr:hypothetical protein [Nitrososphaeraceae archaeon]